MIEVGQRQSIKQHVYIDVPVGTEITPTLLYDKFKVYQDRMEKDGWKLERVTRVHEEPLPVITDKGDVMTRINFDAVTSRPARLLKIETSDAVAEQLIKNPRFTQAD
jgi:hypothetical protein